MKGNKKPFYAADLFAGCGGLSEGFKQAGFKVIAQIERDKWPCETLRTRNVFHFLKSEGKTAYYLKYLREEISLDDIFKKFPGLEDLVNSTVIQAEFGKDSFENILSKIDSARELHGTPKFHIVLGGPPCQPYSVVGRARDPDRMINDNRHFLYEYYLKILKSLKPDFFVFENVPGLITASAGGEEMFSRMLADFREISPSYEIAPSFDEYSRNPREYLVDSSNYGIPQKRKRIIFIGYKRSLLLKSKGIKNVFKKILKAKPPRWGGSTVKDALSDLPSLKPGTGADGYLGKYKKKRVLPYQRRMRKVSPGVLNHKARTHMESDLERYRFFINYHMDGRNNANLIDLINERPDLTPDHNHLDKFLDRFRVQRWKHSSSTITAHISKDGHYYIHPDIKQCRSFTVREAARCQSFYDNFKFEGPRTFQFRQVGNAVPPLLARIIAGFLMAELKRIYEVS